MSWYGRAGVLLFVGVVTGRLILDGGFGWFVQQRMRWPLAIAALILLGFGLYELLTAGGRTDADRELAVTGGRANDHDHDHDHDHEHDGEHAHDDRVQNDDDEDEHAHRHGAGPLVGWLLAAPLLVLMSVAPTALGASAADRVDAYIPTETTNRFEPLPDSDQPVEMRVLDFIDRAVWDADRSLANRVIRLEGLVVNDPDIPDGFKLTRFMVSCCAADGIPLQVAIRNAGQPLENDTWVIADVIWRQPETPYQEIDGDWTVEADPVQISPVVGVPKDPYESPF